MLRSNQDNAVSTLRTVDGRGRGVLQHGEVLDVLNVQVVNVLALKAVHQDVSLRAGTEGGDTANPELTGVLARLSRTLESHDARHVTGQCVRQVRGAVVLQIVHLHSRDCTRDSKFFLCAHTGDDHLVDGVLHIFLHHNVDGGFVTLHQHFLRCVADVGEHQRAVFLHLDGVVTVIVGDGSQAFRVLHDDAGTNNVFTGGIGHVACYGHFSLCQCLQRCAQRQHYYHCIFLHRLIPPWLLSFLP